MAERIRHSRRDAERRLEAVNRLLVTLEALQRDAQVEVRVGEPGLRLRRLAQLRQGLVVAAERRQHVARVGLRFGRSRVEARRLQERRQRFFLPLQLHQRHAEREVRVDQVRERLHLALQHLRGAGEIAQGEVAVAETVAAALVRRGTVRRLERAERLRVARLIEQARAEQAQRLEVRGVLRQRAPGVRLRAGEVVRLERAPALAHSPLPSRWFRRESVSGVRLR